MLFGQFIGNWEIEARYSQPDGTDIRRRGEVHFRWILNGLAIQDVWGMRTEHVQFVPIGTTIRFYDRTIDAWRSTWIYPHHAVVQRFIGRKVGDEIVLESEPTEKKPERWIFSHITLSSFRWRAETTHDEGRSWQLTEEMQVRRSDTG